MTNALRDNRAHCRKMGYETSKLKDEVFSHKQALRFLKEAQSRVAYWTAEAARLKLKEQGKDGGPKTRCSLDRDWHHEA